MEIIFVLLIIGAVVQSVYKNYKEQQKKRPGAAMPKAQPLTKSVKPSAEPSAAPFEEPSEDFSEDLLEESSDEYADKVADEYDAPSLDGNILREITETLLHDESEKERKPAAVSISEGQSKVDAQGCVGGSMDHMDEHEAAAYSAGTALLQTASKRRAEQTRVQGLDNAPRRGLSAAQLRRAVVMSEVLSKPVAMRHPRRYGVR